MTAAMRMNQSHKIDGVYHNDLYTFIADLLLVHKGYGFTGKTSTGWFMYHLEYFGYIPPEGLGQNRKLNNKGEKS